MQSMLDELRKEIDAAMAVYTQKVRNMQVASKELSIAELKLDSLLQAEINLEYEMQRSKE